MIEQQWLQAQFAQVVQQPEPDLDLARAALLIAQGWDPGLNVPAGLAQLDRLARRAAARLDPLASDEERLEALNRVLFSEEGFTGNRAEYYDPRNSFLNQVLERRTGIPITLSAVYLEVGRRLGLRLSGVGLPGHFVVAHHGRGGDVYLDPFSQGALLTIEDCKTLVRQMSNGTLAFRPEYLQPVSKHQILQRMLQNLKAIYERSDDHQSVLVALDHLLIIDPNGPAALRERGLLYLRFRAFASAAADLERFLALAPGGPEAARARRALERVRRTWMN